MLRRLIILILSGFLALSVMGQEASFNAGEHYRKRMSRFASEDKITSADIIMLGNSLTEYAGNWSKLLRKRHVRNRGIAGDVAEGISRRLESILTNHPKAIFLLVGTNDMSHNLTTSQVFERCRKVIDKIRTTSPDTKLFVQSLLPFNESFGRWKLLEGKSAMIPGINRLLAKYCHDHNITFIDLYPKFVRKGTNQLRKELTSDGLHLSPQGYKLWAFELQRYLQAL